MTAPNAGPSIAGRAIEATVYVPVAQQVSDNRTPRFPVFVWAHGYEASVGYFDAMLRALAARGYVIVAPTFPLTRDGAPGGPRYDDYVNQPADVSFIVDRVIGLYGPNGGEHRNLIDPARIAAGGHSLGAVTTMGLIANRCCLDTRIVAAVEVDGSRLAFPGGAPIADHVPLLLLHGDADRTFPVTESESIYATARPPKFLVVLHGMPHTAFKIPRAFNVIVRVIADFLDASLGQDPFALEKLQRDASINGLATLQFAR